MNMMNAESVMALAPYMNAAVMIFLMVSVTVLGTKKIVLESVVVVQNKMDVASVMGMAQPVKILVEFH